MKLPSCCGCPSYLCAALGMKTPKTWTHLISRSGKYHHIIALLELFIATETVAGGGCVCSFQHWTTVKSYCHTWAREAIIRTSVFIPAYTLSMTVCHVSATCCPVGKWLWATFRPRRPCTYHSSISHTCDREGETGWKPQQVIFGFLLASMCCPRHSQLLGQSWKRPVLTGRAQITRTQKVRGQSPEVHEVFVPPVRPCRS